MEFKKTKRVERRLFLGTCLLAGLCLLTMWCITPAYAQQSKTITGTVVDKSGEPLAGVTVALQGTSVVTLTDGNGQYSITVQNDNQQLRFSFIGYKPVTVGTAQRIANITLEEDALLIDEVVVTAMGIKKERKALGYAVQELKADEIMKNKTANLINSLSGKIAGVNVTQTSGGAGAGATIILRGGTSLQRDNQPLFVVDGIIYDNSTSINGNSSFDGATSNNSTYSNRVMDINPDDIESMSVLKGPAAAALYGSRAAAGVIVITTKKGEEGRIQVNVSSKYQTNWANRLPEQQSQYKRGSYAQNGDLLEGDATTTMSSWGAKFGAGETVYNNMENFFQTAGAWDNSVSVSGGTKNGSFYFSASNFSQTGIIPNSSYDKTTFRFNGEQRYGILKVGANVAYSIADQLSSLTSSGLYNASGEGAVQGAYLWPRDLDMENWLNDDGTKYRLFPSELVQNDYDNPYWVLNKMPRTDRTNRLTANVTLDLNITDWWSINYNLGTDRYTSNTRRFTEPGSGVSIDYSRGGLLSEGDRTYEYLSSNLMTNFHKQFGDFDFNLLLGTSAEATEVLYNGRKGWDFVIPGFYAITNTSSTTHAISQSKTQKRLVGFYGEFRASYKNLAYVTVTGRNDWTSTLPIENRSYFYPSVSGSFVFTELLPKNDILSFGKIRASWARVGKDADAYATNTYVKSQFTIYDNGNGLGVRNDELQDRGNPYLIPEITQSQEYGIELRFFDGRLNIDYAFYQNKSINQLVKPRMPQSPGYITALTNAGVIVNNGMELAVNVVPVQTKDFRWDLTVNASGNRGKVEELLPGMDYLYLTDVQYSNAKAASFPDGSFMAISGSQWLRSPDGYLVVNKDSGMPTSDGLVNHQVGDREPKVFGGINNSLQYKNWNLSFLLDYRIGGDVFNGTDWYLTTNGMSARSADRESLTITGVVNEGTATAPVYSEPKTFEYKTGQMYQIGTQQQSGAYIIRNYFADGGAYGLETANYITDVNWLRLRSVSLSYSLPESILRKLKVVKNLTATVTGTNLFVWTNYKGMDPETSAAGSGIVGPTSVGIDYCGVPALAGVSFGLNLTF